jgi:hypothetical protein
MHSVFWQISPSGHCAVMMQPTHWPFSVSQTGLVAGHWASLVQPETGWHVCVSGLQASPSGQVSGLVKQATHTPSGSSQYGVAGVVTHPSLEVHFVVGPSARPSL